MISSNLIMRIRAGFVQSASPLAETNPRCFSKMAVIHRKILARPFCTEQGQATHPWAEPLFMLTCLQAAAWWLGRVVSGCCVSRQCDVWVPLWKGSMVTGQFVGLGNVVPVCCVTGLYDPTQVRY